MNIAQAYNSGLQGWAGPELAKREFDMLSARGHFVPFPKFGPYRAKRMMLFDVTRKLLGKDTINYAQQIGDCVSFGMKNAVEYLQAVEILINKDAEGWKPIFPPYIYGISRVQVGGGRLNGDGSLGSWAAAGVQKYGIINSDATNVPQYSGSVAKKWGDRPGPPNEFISLGQKHLARKASQLNSVDQLCDAICGGFPCTIASMQGFDMKPDSRGFHRATGQWAHQMSIIGIDLEHSEPYVIILNSWGEEAHGELKDFNTGEKLPGGCIRARISEIQRSMITGGDAELYAIGQLDGFPDEREKLSKALFKMI